MERGREPAGKEDSHGESVSSGKAADFNFSDTHRHLLQLDPLDPGNIPIATPAQQADFSAHMLKRDIGDARGGLASASEHALSEVHLMREKGLLNNMVDDLEKGGGVKVLRDKEGNPTHLQFDAPKGSKAIDIDVNAETFNGKGAEDLHKESVKAAKEYSDAKFDDKRIKDLNGKDISPEVRKAAKELNDAMLDGDKDALARIGKNILQSRELTDGVDRALKSINQFGNLSIVKDDKGEAHIKATGTAGDLAVSKDGKLEKADFDYKDLNWKFSDDKDLSKTLKEAAGFGLYEVNEEIGANIYNLSTSHKMPADGRTNMKALEKAEWGEVAAARKRFKGDSED